MILQVDSLAVLDVFDTTSYILILLSILVTFLVFMFLVWLNKMKHHFKYTHAIFYIVVSFFQATYPESKLPRGSLKLILMWYFYSMILSYMYMSVLIQKLTVTKYVEPVDTIEDILNQDLVPFIFEYSSLVKEWKNANDQSKR